jgi:predicted metal-dependent enzyme (double-stranded beta helix superfamily)
MKKLSLPVAIERLIGELKSKKKFAPSEIVRLIKNANISESDIEEWSNFNHDIMDGYGRKLLYKTDNFEVMVMSWSQKDYSAVHNHGYTNWGAVKVFGSLEHTTFHYEDGYLSTLIKEHLSAGQILAVNQNLIHQMGNPGTENILSLHIYGTAENIDQVTSDSQLFEIGKKEVQYTDGGVFYDLKNDAITSRTSGLETDRLTEIGHYTQLLNYYYKSKRKGPQYNAAVNYFHNRSFESSLILEMEMDSKHVLYGIELRKAKKLLELLSEDTTTIDSILFDINDIDKYS